MIANATARSRGDNTRRALAARNRSIPVLSLCGNSGSSSTSNDGTSAGRATTAGPSTRDGRGTPRSRSGMRRRNRTLFDRWGFAGPSLGSLITGFRPGMFASVSIAMMPFVPNRQPCGPPQGVTATFMPIPGSGKAGAWHKDCEGAHQEPGRGLNNWRQDYRLVVDTMKKVAQVIPIILSGGSGTSSGRQALCTMPSDRSVVCS